MAYAVVGAGKSKFEWQAGRLEIQVRVNVTVLSLSLSLKSTGQASGLGKLRVSLVVWKQIYFFFGKTSVFILKASTDWMRLTHILEGNLFTQSLLIVTISHILQKILQRHVDWCLTKQLVAITMPSLHIKLTIIHIIQCVY